MVRRVVLVAVVALGACGGDAPGAPTTDAPVWTASAPAARSTAAATTTPLTSTSVVPVGFEAVPLTVTNADGTVCELCVWRAETADERSRGLMGVTDLGAADGMAFVYGAPVTNRFWMRDTPLALDIAWFDAQGALVSTATMAPCLAGPVESCARYGATGPYVLAVEVVAGRLAELGIGPDSVAELGAGTGCDTD